MMKKSFAKILVAAIALAVGSSAFALTHNLFDVHNKSNRTILVHVSSTAQGVKLNESTKLQVQPGHYSYKINGPAKHQYMVYVALSSRGSADYNCTVHFSNDDRTGAWVAEVHSDYMNPKGSVGCGQYTLTTQRPGKDNLNAVLIVKDDSGK